MICFYGSDEIDDGLVIELLLSIVVHLCLLFYELFLLPVFLLLIFLLARKGSFHSLDNAVALHLRYLPLLFIPAAMGIITQLDIITKEFWAIVIALFVGTLVALVFSAKFMDFLTSKADKNEL